MYIVVTGGTDGIGFALTKKFLKLDHTVFIVGKDSIKGNKVIKSLDTPNVEFFECDLSEKEEIKKLIEKFNKMKTIDVLVNNAGAIFDKRLVTSNGIEKTFALNHLSYLQLSLGLMEKLENSKISRIINISSEAHRYYKFDMNDLENKISYNGWKAYCRSKLLNILKTYYFKKKLNTKINCNCLHPGFVNSNFGNNNKSVYRFAMRIIKKFFAISNDKASEPILRLVTSKNFDGINGKYFDKFKEIKSSKDTYNSEIAKFVWDKSIDYIK